VVDELGEPVPPLAEERLDILRELGRSSGQDLLGEILHSYLTETPSKLGRLRLALEAGDVQALIFSAHSLKGISAQLGVERVAGLAARLERAGQAGALDDCAALLLALEQEWTLVRPLLEARR
jgi:HPt (histidine-containing phosphotransfer) domain-containing protein